MSSSVACPFCGEVDEIYVDPGGGDAQVYTEDCAVCCRPRVVHVEPGDAPGEGPGRRDGQGAPQATTPASLRPSNCRAPPIPGRVAAAPAVLRDMDSTR